MEAHLRPVPTPDAEETELADTPRDFEEFYGSTFRRLFTALCLVTGNRHEAEEIMQDAFVRVYERWERVSRLDVGAYSPSSLTKEPFQRPPFLIPS
jgi:DNA-directed RNA polymerase specialized sigma24 family protein